MGFLANIPHKTEGASNKKTIKKLEKELKEFGFESGDFVKRLMQVSMDFFSSIAKGQLISKASCQAEDSSKKRTNGFVFTSMQHVFVRFLEESSARKKRFEII